MHWFNNLLIRWKLIAGFGAVIVLTIILAVVSVASSNRVDADYTYLLNFPQQRLVLLKNAKDEFTNMRRLAVTSVLETEKRDLVEKFYDQFNQAYSNACDYLDEYIDKNKKDTIEDTVSLQNSIEQAEKLRKDLTDYKTQIVEPAIAIALAGNQKDAKDILAAGGPILTQAGSIVDELCGGAESFLNEYSNNITVQKNTSNMIFAFVTLTIVFFRLSSPFSLAAHSPSLYIDCWM